ncbi:MAG: hypothetical protein EOO62_38290 [Hymenobacter sp.]|nr:MAG: hypothetical protein EOO62_38290 [Hymenobacter sp.]
MARSLLTLLLLLHYLLVVCVSVHVRPDHLPARPLTYMHGHDCQLKNAWRGGTCFEDCNGVQYQVHKGHKPIPLQQLLTSLKGMDLHCLPAAAALTGSATFGEANCLLPGWNATMPTGVRGKIYAPPRRG